MNKSGGCVCKSKNGGEFDEHSSEKQSFDIQSFLSKLPGLPWSKYPGEKHLPGYNYCGPGTRLDWMKTIDLDQEKNQ